MDPTKGSAVARAKAYVDAGAWSDTPYIVERIAAHLQTKTAVGGLELDTSVPSALASFARGAFAQTLLGRISGGRRGPFLQSTLNGRIIGVGAAWRKNGRAIPVAKVAMGRAALYHRSVDALIVASQSYMDLAAADGTAAETLADLLTDEIRKRHDSVFVGTAAGTTDQQSAGIAYNAHTVASTGATAALITADVRSMVAAQVDGVGSVRDSAFVVSAEAYSLLAMFKLLDANGATLAGRPIVSDAPSGTFLLVDMSSLSYAIDDSNVDIIVSTEGMIEMSDAPTGNTITPTAASASIISLFQEDAVAMRANLYSDWLLDSAHADSSGNPAVIRLTGATYA